LTAWVWSLDLGPVRPEVDIGGGIKLPTYRTGLRGHAAWSVVVLMCVSGSIFASHVFAYFFLWTVNEAGWPPPGPNLPEVFIPWTIVGLLLASSLCVFLAGRALRSHRGVRGCPLAVYPLLLLATAGLGCALAVEGWAQLQSGVRPGEHAYGAVVMTFLCLNGILAAALAYMALLCAARGLAGKLDRVRRVTFENMELLWYYAVGQILVGTAVVHLAPRLIG
jgi:cytochrome c oxidase subunit I+III